MSERVLDTQLEKVNEKVVALDRRIKKIAAKVAATEGRIKEAKRLSSELPTDPTPKQRSKAPVD